MLHIMYQVTHNLGVQAVCTPRSNLVTETLLLMLPSHSSENAAFGNHSQPY